MTDSQRRALLAGVVCPLAAAIIAGADYIKIILAAICIILLLGAVICSPLIGAFSIWRIVHWFNLRDDPRYAKRPSDAP